MTDPKQQLPEEQKTRVWLFLVGLVGQLGFMIALPIVLLAFGGRLLDARLQMSPVFLLAGIALAGIITTAWVVRRMRTLRDQYLKMLENRPATQKRV